jgi:hypothetical protein
VCIYYEGQNGIEIDKFKKTSKLEKESYQQDIEEKKQEKNTLLIALTI